MSQLLEMKELLAITRAAEAAIGQYHLVKAGAADTGCLAATANARCLGVSPAAYATDDIARIVVSGIMPCVAGNTVAAGDMIIADASGHGVPAGATGNQAHAGVALSGAVSGGLFSLLISPETKYADSTAGGVGGATITVGAEVAHATHSITCNIQLEDCYGAALACVGVVQAYLSDDSAGKDVSTLVPTTDLAAGTDGAVIVTTQYKSYILISEADGDIDVVLIKTDGADTCYLNIVLPSGKIVTSTAITFSA